MHDLFLLLMTYSESWGGSSTDMEKVVILKLEDNSTGAKRDIVPKLGGNIYSPHLLALQLVITHPTWDNHRSNLVRVNHKLATYHK